MSEVNQLVEIRAEEATQRGLPPVSIRLDARAGSMTPRKFPASDVYLKLNGPPGAPLLLIIFDCRGSERDDAALIQSKFVPAWTKELELGGADRAHVLGAEQPGVTFATGGGIARTAWFGFVIERGAARLLITIGVGGRDNVAVPATEVVSNPAIRRVLDTLQIEARPRSP
ncbi:MAG: hypothetical protein HOV81_24395 [Kofleriaceae bacterium]|nr:hypothetical protein [Kofleriaceae bacterium]